MLFRSLAAALKKAVIAVEPAEPGVLTTASAPASRVGEVAASAGIVLHELATIHASLEDAYLRLTNDSVEYRTDTTGRRPAAQ